ncbi:MAG: hypothetical protein KBH85_05450, partial [Lachnospiraceae bacterium]|nr:hypothetical protein [Lachnospiraceae bacterium]
YDGERAHIYVMNRNTQKTPVVVIINESMAEGLLLPVMPTEDSEDALASLDTRFEKLFEDVCAGNTQSCVYLLGEGFKKEWMKKSLKVLCSNGRRVFQGNNLFSTGACFCLMDMRKPSAESASHIYLGRDKLRANVGINVFDQGREEYFSIFDAGTTWYDAQMETDCIMGDDQTIQVIVTPLDGQKVHTEVLTIRDIPERPPRTTRIHISFTMKSIYEVKVTVTDMGFGEIFPSSGQKQEFIIRLDQ